MPTRRLAGSVRTSRRVPSLVLAAAASVLLAPSVVSACGGLFCSAGNPVAVEQNAERILFTENTDGTYSAYIEISYVGAPEGFSWVVPVPDTPTLDVAPASTLRLLDALTRPSITPPPTKCSNPLRSTGMACAESDVLATAGRGVMVEELDRVGPYEPKVVSAEDPSLLFDWLTTNGYLLTDEMRPYVEGYAQAGMKFLALRLAPDAGVSDIAPIKLTFATPCPMVPLALTAVSAEPEMSVLVLFLGKTRMRAANYQNLVIDPRDVRIDALRRDNYYALVSHRIDEAGGRAFVTELAAPSSTLRDPSTVFFQGNDVAASVEYLQGLLSELPYATRLYARLSAWEMTLDPEFEESDGDDVSNVFDLSGRPALETCGEVTGVPCGSTYCGPGSECGVTEDGSEGCVCKEGTVARVVTSPDLRLGSTRTVTCQDRRFNVLFSAQLAGPCLDYACTGGSCVVTNGFPTCACDPGEVARIDPERTSNGVVRGMVCEPAVESWGPERLLWLEESEGCAAGVGLGWAVLGLVVLRRRRVRA